MATAGPKRGSKSRILLGAFGDAEAFAAFYGRYREGIVTYFARRTASREIALDLTADTFETALRLRHRFRGHAPEQEQSWLFAIARSALSHYLRRTTAERTALAQLARCAVSAATADLERVDEIVGAEALRPALEAGLHDLQSGQRRAVLLRVVNELDYPALAAQLDITEATARARVSRGLRALSATVKSSDAPSTRARIVVQERRIS